MNEDRENDIIEVEHRKRFRGLTNSHEFLSISAILRKQSRGLHFDLAKSGKRVGITTVDFILVLQKWVRRVGITMHMLVTCGI